MKNAPKVVAGALAEFFVAERVPMNVAILDDYQNVALRLADWSGVRRHAEITVFNDHVADPSAVVERLRGATQNSLRDKSKPPIIWLSFRICQETSSGFVSLPSPFGPHHFSRRTTISQVAFASES
jgi:hypothetical protein